MQLADVRMYAQKESRRLAHDDAIGSTARGRGYGAAATAKLSSSASRTAVTSARLAGSLGAGDQHRRLVEGAQQQVGQSA